VSGLSTAVLPLCLGGALFAAVSSGRSITSPGHRKSRARGARWATRHDLRAVLLDHDAPHPGRLALGTVHGFLHPTVVAAERAQSVVVVGPTQSGKTTALAVPAILAWEGPVVAASVKSDLLRATQKQRNDRGRIWCIDPSGSVGARPSTWSPLTLCADWAGANRIATDLAESAKADGTTADGEFWYATAAKLLAPLFFAAANDRRSMADVVRWVDTQEASEVSSILEQAGVTEALDAARATWCRDERTRSSVYTTAETILAPFAGGKPGSDAFEPAELLAGCHTLYLCAPAHDQRRLRGYFTALTQQVLSHAFTQATRSGKPLDPPLLVVLDEAAHIAPLPELDGLAATCASHGIQLVTVWQDLAHLHEPTDTASATKPGRRRWSTTTGPSYSCPASPTPRPSITPVCWSATRSASSARSPEMQAAGYSTTSTRQPRRLLPPTFGACPGVPPCSSTAPCRRSGCACGRGGRRLGFCAGDTGGGRRRTIRRIRWPGQ